MVKLPGGLSLWQAAQQIGDDINPFDGGSIDRDIFSEKYNQRNGQQQWHPQPAIEVSPTSGNTQQNQSNSTTSNNNNPNNSNNSSSADRASTLAYLSSQQANLDRQMGRTGTTLEQGLTRISNDYADQFYCEGA